MICYSLWVAQQMIINSWLNLHVCFSTQGINRVNKHMDLHRHALTNLQESAPYRPMACMYYPTYIVLAPCESSQRHAGRRPTAPTGYAPLRRRSFDVCALPPTSLQESWSVVRV